MMRQIFPVLLALLPIVATAQINIQWVARNTSAGNNIDRANQTVRDKNGNNYVVGTSWNGSNFDYRTMKVDADGNVLWTANYNGPGNSYDEGRAIAVDTLGNCYVTGYSAGASANYDYATVCYDANGTQMWVTRYNGPASGFDEAYDIAVDDNSNVYVTGGSDGSGTGSDFCTIKYNSAGVQQWATRYTFTGANIDAAYALHLTASGDVYVTGSSFTSTGADIDIATIRYNNNGVQQWVARYNGPGSAFDTGTDLVVDETSGAVYVGGYQRALTGITNFDYAILKYNNTGALQWNQSYGGAGNELDRVNKIALDNLNHVIVTGRSVGTTTTAEDMVTLQLDATAGTIIWTDRYDSGINNYDEGNDLTIDAAGNIYVAGYGFITGANNNFFVLKYTNTGDREWFTMYNGPANNSDQAYSMTMDTLGNLYVAGPSRGVGTNEDYALVKFCQLTSTAGADTTICLGATVQLNATSSFGGIDSVWWVPAAGLNQSNIANPLASPTATTSYVLHIRNQYGCIDLDTVVVTVVPLPGPVIQASGPLSFCEGGSVTLTVIDTSSTTVAYLWNTGATTSSIIADASGTYNVIITNNATCSSQSFVNVTENPLPNIDAGNDVGFCVSATVQLCATGGVQYSWSPAFGLSDTTIACPTAGPTSSTTYIVFGTDANGCVSSDTVSVNLYPIPSVPTITQNIAVLTSSTASSYQWYYNGNPISGATSQSYTPTQNGSYYVVVTDSNGCVSFSSTFVMNEVGVDEISAGAISLFPNPNNGTFTLQFEEAATGTLRVFDAQGRVVFADQINAQNAVNINLNAPAGMFWCEWITAGGERTTIRFVIN
jgi:uncharacterized delta-60 repeat protein